MADTVQLDCSDVENAYLLNKSPRDRYLELMFFRYLVNDCKIKPHVTKSGTVILNRKAVMQHKKTFRAGWTCHIAAMQGVGQIKKEESRIIRPPGVS